MIELKAEVNLAYQVDRSCNKIAMQYMECDTHLLEHNHVSIMNNIRICFAFKYMDIQADSSSVPQSNLLSWKQNTLQFNPVSVIVHNPHHHIPDRYSIPRHQYAFCSPILSLYVGPSHRLLSIINHTTIISPSLTNLNHSCLTTRIAPSYSSAFAFIAKVVLDLVVCANIIPTQLGGVSISTVSVNSWCQFMDLIMWFIQCHFLKLLFYDQITVYDFIYQAEIIIVCLIVCLPVHFLRKEGRIFSTFFTKYDREV